MDDIKLSKKVADEAGKKIAELKAKVTRDKDVHISILKDCLNDLRLQNRFIKKVVWVLCSIILFLIISLVSLSIYSQERLIRFLSNYEFESVIENNLTNDGSYDDNNSISVDKGK